MRHSTAFRLLFVVVVVFVVKDHLDSCTTGIPLPLFDQNLLCPNAQYKALVARHEKKLKNKSKMGKIWCNRARVIDFDLICIQTHSNSTAVLRHTVINEFVRMECM